MTTELDEKGQKALVPKAEVEAESCLHRPCFINKVLDEGWHMLSFIPCEGVTASESGRFIEPDIFSVHVLANGELPKTKRGRERVGQWETRRRLVRECLL